MGRMLGTYAEDEDLDRADLNKCPDCGCYFAQDDCPLCGKPCPEHMRAGNRTVVKQKKRKKKNNNQSGRVVFIDWYYSWWFIILMMFLMPVVGILLLITSPHDKSKKTLFIVIAVIYLIISTIGISSVIGIVKTIFDRPVDTSLSKEDYIAACQTVAPEEFYRNPARYEDKFVTMTIKVVDYAQSADFYVGNDHVYYLCEAENGSVFTIIIRDCQVENNIKLIRGDVITVYGEGAGEVEVLDQEYDLYNEACLNVAYITIKR